jgi:hypothetical protein
MEPSKISILKSNTLELHYYLNNETHRMDANVQNKCEYELLGLVKEIALKFDVEIIIETCPLAEGGIRRWFKVVSKKENKSALITTALLIALVSTILITPLTTVVSKATEKLIERIFEDKELKELEKEKLKLEIEKLRREIDQKNLQLDQNTVIKKRRSNFYESLEKDIKVNQISFIIEDEENMPTADENIVDRSNFKDFILISDELEPVEKDNAIIEIISPVLKKGNFRWLGILDGEQVTFNMKSNEFKTLVQTGKIEFKNGSSLNCLLTIRKKIDNEGIEKIVGYDITRVNHYFENDKPIETPEGKFHRQKQDADKNQGKLSFIDPLDKNSD